MLPGSHGQQRLRLQWQGLPRARALASAEPALACHLAEWAALADPKDRDAQQCVIDVFKQRAEGEISLMGRGILSHAVRRAESALEEMGVKAE